MNGSKNQRRIRKLVQLLIKKYNVPSIHAEDIADCLECSRDVVIDELGLLYEEGVLKPVFEAHCGVCGNIMASGESPRYLLWGLAIAECPWCLNQQKFSRDDLVSAWVICEETEDDECLTAGAGVQGCPWHCAGNGQ